jgi:CRISPR/Cas system endoribonuclease Cas6 (RAMP superfamily)
MVKVGARKIEVYKKKEFVVLRKNSEDRYLKVEFGSGEFKTLSPILIFRLGNYKITVNHWYDSDPVETVKLSLRHVGRKRYLTLNGKVVKGRKFIFGGMQIKIDQWNNEDCNVSA